MHWEDVSLGEIERWRIAADLLRSAAYNLSESAHLSREFLFRGIFPLKSEILSVAGAAKIHRILISNPSDSESESDGFQLEIHWISDQNPLDFWSAASRRREK